LYFAKKNQLWRFLQMGDRQVTRVVEKWRRDDRQVPP
jgi:hypothetical protein